MLKEKILNPRYQYLDEKKEHLHCLDGKALIGTTTALGVLSKPLTWWAAECAAVECLEAGIKIDTIRAEYESAKNSPDKSSAIKLLEKKYPIFRKARYAHNEVKKTSAKKGTDLHAELERFCKTKMGLMDVKDFDPKINPFMDWTEKNVKRFLASEGYCYSEKLWTGGGMDAVAELNDGSYMIIDFKSSKEAYMSQFVQCGAYSLQIAENGILDKDGKWELKLDKPISSMAIVPFGAEKVEPVIRYDVKNCEEGFRSAVALYKLIELNQNIT